MRDDMKIPKLLSGILLEAEAIITSDDDEPTITVRLNNGDRYELDNGKWYNTNSNQLATPDIANLCYKTAISNPQAKKILEIEPSQNISISPLPSARRMPAPVSEPISTELKSSGSPGEVPPEDVGSWGEEEIIAAQLKNYGKALADAEEDGYQGYTPKIEDKNPPDAPKDYKALTKTWLPLLVDGGEKWSINDVIDAMRPITKMFANEYARISSNLSREDLMTYGDVAVIKALLKDKGLAPFGLFAAKEIKRTITAEAKGTGLISTGGVGVIPEPQRKRQYHQKYASLQQPIGKGEGAQELGSQVKSGEGTDITKIECPYCNNKGEVDGETCGVCNGRGFIPVSNKEESPKTPDEIVSSNEQLRKKEEWLARVRGILSHILSNQKVLDLSDGTIEAVLMRYGAEGLFDYKLTSSNIEKMPTEIARIISAADTAGEIWNRAIKNNATDQFQEIWRDYTGEEFMPDVRIALQIASGEGNLDTEADYVKERNEFIDRLQNMIISVDPSLNEADKEKAIKDGGIKYSDKSRTSVANKLKKFKNKLEIELASDTGMLDRFEKAINTGMPEFIEILDSCITENTEVAFRSILEGVDNGTLSIKEAFKLSVDTLDQ